MIQLRNDSHKDSFIGILGFKTVVFKPTAGTYNSYKKLDSIIVQTLPFTGGWTFAKLAKRGGNSIFFLNKGRDRKKGWDGVIRGGGEIKKIYKTSLKETQTLKAY